MAEEGFKSAFNMSGIGNSSTSIELAGEGYEGALVRIAALEDSDEGGARSWKDLGQEAARIAQQVLRKEEKVESAEGNEIYRSALEAIASIQNREGNLSWKDRAEIAMGTANDALTEHYYRTEAFGEERSWEEQQQEARDGIKVCMEYALRDIQEAGVRSGMVLNPEIYSQTVGRALQELADFKNFDQIYGFQNAENDPAMKIMVNAITEIGETRAGWKEIGPQTAEIAGSALREVRGLREQDLAAERQSQETDIGVGI